MNQVTENVINAAAEWLNKHIDEYIITSNNGAYIDKIKFIENFKNEVLNGSCK